MSNLTITRVETFLTMPSGSPHSRLIVVKVHTSEPGLFGLGCATFHQRHRAVQAALDHHIGPFVVGKDPRNIEDLWQSAMVNGYWRNGPVLNNAIAAVDIALWDIAGKLARAPCYQLWGGKCREAAAVYVHADGKEVAQVIDNARQFMERGFRYIRCQLGGYPVWKAPRPARRSARRRAPTSTRAKNSAARPNSSRPCARPSASRWSCSTTFTNGWPRLTRSGWPRPWSRTACSSWRTCWHRRTGSGSPRCAASAPRRWRWANCFDHPLEFVPLVAGRLIDFVRCHITAIGGITPAIKLAHLCEAFGVRTAWHGPAT